MHKEKLTVETIANEWKEQELGQMGRNSGINIFTPCDVQCNQTAL